MSANVPVIPLAPGDLIPSLFAPLTEVPALQLPNQDTVLRKWRIFDPGQGVGRLDARLYLDVQALEKMLAVARSSMTLRAVIHGLEIELEDREDKTGHRYVVARFVGIPRPESIV